VINRVRKLLALAASTSSADEAATAAAQAQRLMSEYQIDLAEAALDETAPVDEPLLHTAARRADGERGAPLDSSESAFPKWKGTLTYHLGKANNVFVYCSQQRAGTYTFEMVGRKSDMLAVAYTYQYLVREIDRLAKVEGKGRGRSWANSFRLGAVETVGQRLREERNALVRARRTAAEATGNDRALVRVNAALAAVERRGAEAKEWAYAHVHLHASRRSRARDYDGLEAGRRAGASIGLSGAKASLGTGAKQLK
jgi:hypothetical protein